MDRETVYPSKLHKLVKMKGPEVRSVFCKFPSIIGAIAVSFLGALSFADPMPVLSPEDRKEWAAVGRLNTGGFRVTSLCTATLIAPDLILTAAHCAGRSDGASKKHFLAGWDRSVFVAHRRTMKSHVHPHYLVDGKANFKKDVAVVLLDRPIQTDTLSPIPIARLVQPPSKADLILGYHRSRPHVLNGRRDCDLRRNKTIGLLQYDCEVISGNSGGPVLHLGPDGWAVTAVVVARSNNSGDAIAVPIDSWIMRHWLDAKERHEARMKNQD